VQLHCNDCLAVWSVSESELAAGKASGSITEKLVQGRQEMWNGTTQPTSSTTYLGICAACQAKHRLATAPRKRLTADQEFLEIRKLVERVRLAHPEWPLKRCTFEAVEWVTRPEIESDPAYRAYLMDRE
jgi:hypothetical protein